MNEDLQKIIAEQMKKLPKDVVEAIISVDYKAQLEEITKLEKLLMDKAAKLEMETTLVMMGLEPLNDYVDNLARELEISTLKAKEIALMVSEKIFKPIRESLHAMNSGAEAETDTGPNSMPADHKGKDSHNLNRAEILKEIENPVKQTGTAPVINTTADINLAPETVENTEPETHEIAINTKRELETLDVTPYQKDVVPPSSLVSTKMSDTVITKRQVLEAEPSNKLPEVTKKIPTSGTDPYREPII